MKRIVAVLLLVVIACSLFAACNVTECDICGTRTTCSQMKVLGQKKNVCSNCKKTIDDVGNAIGSLFGG